MARAILGGLIAGEPATLFVLPCLYSLMVRDPKGTPSGPGPVGDAADGADSLDGPDHGLDLDHGWA